MELVNLCNLGRKLLTCSTNPSSPPHKGECLGLGKARFVGGALWPIHKLEILGAISSSRSPSFFIDSEECADYLKP